ncbi:MAG TPA: glycosyltransferase family A protein [Pyrinomonadaceae bacterium]|jgi:alpha-1,3-rhamnosyltransferase
MDKDRQKGEVFAFVPSYNHAPYIEKCLNSIIGQTLPPAKLLVIDDGSRDDSPRIIERVLKNCPFDAELMVRENRGLCKTLNEGLSLSAGKYFAYVGSDDYWLPRFFEERVKLMERRESAVLGFGHAFFIDDNDQIFGASTDIDEDWAQYADGNPSLMLLNGGSPVSSSVFYRRSALEKVSWNEDARLEDYEMYVRLATFGDFAFDPQVLSVWRYHSYNTSKDLVLMHREVIEAQNRNIEFLGVSRAELDKFQARIKFRNTRILLQNGNKREALKLGKESWRSAGSAKEIGKALVHLALPKSVLDAYRKRKREKQAARYLTDKNEK